MAYFPFFIDIQEKHCLVAGGGAVACRKVKTLLMFDVNITVIAPTICDELKELVQEDGKLILLEREFEKADIRQSFFVIAATNNSVVNETISALCKEAGILVNVCDSKESSNFLFPAVVKRGDVVIGTSTSGNSPDMARWVRTQIDWAIPDYVSELADSLGSFRIPLKERIPTEEMRKLAFKELMYLGMKNEGNVDETMLEQVISHYNSKSIE